MIEDIDTLRDESDLLELEQDGDGAECSPGWETRCREATSERCGCACGGRNHGKDAYAKLIGRNNASQ